MRKDTYNVMTSAKNEDEKRIGRYNVCANQRLKAVCSRTVYIGN